MNRLANEIAQAQSRTPPAAAALPKSGMNRLDVALSGHPVRKPITVPIVPGYSIPAVMTIVGSDRSLDLEGEVAAKMAQRGIERNVLNQGKFELELAKRTLTEAVLDSEANPVPLADLATWGRLAPEVISDLWIEYSELRAQHDPAIAELTQQDVDDIRDAVVKKNGPQLRYFGATSLAAFLLTLADLLASSESSKSSPGGSSSED